MLHSTYYHKILLPKKRRAYQELFVLILLLISFISAIPYTEAYNRQTFLYNDLLESGGCVAFTDCPKYLDDQILEETGGLYPPQYYERDSKDYWRSFCTYDPESCVK